MRPLAVIPDFAICQIEGRNGIGKSLSARLLEIISGQQPYVSLPNAWASLTELLGRVTVEVDGLPGGHRIVYNIDSTTWPRQVPLGGDQFDPTSSIFLNGAEISWSEARRYLQVRRIAGDEGISETLGRILLERSTVASAANRRAASVSDSWAHESDQLNEASAGISRQALDEQLRRVRAASLELQDRSRHSAIVLDRAGSARDGLLALDWLMGFYRSYDQLFESYKASHSGYGTAVAEVARLEEQLGIAALRRQNDVVTRARIAKWDKLREGRQRALARARINEQQLVRSLGIPARPTALEIAELRRGLIDEMQTAERELQTVDLAGEVRSLAVEMSALATKRPSEVLTEQLISTPLPMSGQELVQSLTLRSEQLRNVPRPGQAKRLETRVSELRRKIALVDRLPDAIKVTDRKLQLVQEAMQEARTLEGFKGTEASSATYAAALDLAREQLATATIAAASLLADLRQLLSDDEIESSDDRVNDLLKEAAALEDDDALLDAPATPQLLEPSDIAAQALRLVGKQLSRVSESQLKSPKHAIPAHPAELQWSLLSETYAPSAEEVRAYEQQAEAELNEVAQSRAAAEDARRGWQILSIRTVSLTRELLARDGAYTTWRSGLEVAARRVGTSLELLGAWAARPDSGAIEQEGEHLAQPAETSLLLAAAFIEQVRSTVMALTDGAAQIRDAWATASEYFKATSHRLQQRTSADLEPVEDRTGRRAVVHDLLRQWTEADLSSLLSTAELRAALFDGASAVSFDLGSLAVSWRAGDGRRRRRPLEAFSSGEQVFAYTRAKLEQLRGLSESALGTVLILDEFGAFVARDRFSQLMSFVEHSALGAVANQVVVLLPLSSEGVDLLESGEVGPDVYRDTDYIARATGRGA